MHCHHHEKPDRLTWAAFAGELVNHFITNPYFLGQFYDACTQSEPKYLGLSENALYFSPFCLSAFGAAYCHLKLNHNHQPASTSPLLTSRALRESEEIDHNIDDILGTPRNRNVPPLIWWQWFALAGDGIAHVCEVAAPLSFAFDLSTKHLNPPSWLRTTWQIAAFSAGIVGAIAPVRTCKNSIQGAYSSQLQKGDRLTKANFWIDAVANIVSNAAWTSQLLGAVLPFVYENMVNPIEKINDPLHVESLDFWACILVGLSTGSAAAYLHYLLNKHHQNSSTQVVEPINSAVFSQENFDSTQSSCNILRFLIKAADLFTHAGDKASSLSFIATLANSNDPMSNTTNLIVQLCALAWGMLTGIADSRTCTKAYDKEIDLAKLRTNYSDTDTVQSPKGKVQPTKKRQVSIQRDTLFGKSKHSINGDFTGLGNQPIVIPRRSSLSTLSDVSDDTVVEFNPDEIRSDSTYQKF